VAEVVLRLRVLDHAGPRVADTWWQRTVDTAHLPGEGDDVQLWGEHDGPAAPVKRRWWRPDGRVCVEVVQVSVDSPTRADPLGEDGRLKWLPWSSSQGDVAELLRGAGWELLQDD
jgi:hypothetical protein